MKRDEAGGLIELAGSLARLLDGLTRRQALELYVRTRDLLPVGHPLQSVLHSELQRKLQAEPG